MIGREKQRRQTDKQAKTDNKRQKRKKQTNKQTKKNKEKKKAQTL